MNDRPAHIYIVTDPRDESIRYVGCTTKPEQRRKTHTSKLIVGNRAFRSWKQGLVDSGLVPQFRIVDSCGVAESTQLESDWIMALDSDHLLNVRKKPFNSYLANRLCRIDQEWRWRNVDWR